MKKIILLLTLALQFCTPATKRESVEDTIKKVETGLINPVYLALAGACLCWCSQPSLVFFTSVLVKNLSALPTGSQATGRHHHGRVT